MNLRYTYTRLNVSNFLACKAFYQGVLGLKTVFEDDRDEYIEFNTGFTKITLFNRKKLTDFVDSEVPLTYGENSSNIVLTFTVDNVENTVKDLEAQGVKMISRPSNYPDRGFISACFRDPDGNLIELEEVSDVLVS